MSTARPSAALRRELARARDATLAEPRFVASPRLSALLVHLVARTLDGESGPLDARRAAAEVLGRPPAGEPGADPALRVLLGRLRRVLDERCARITDAPVLRLPSGSHRIVLESGSRGHVSRASDRETVRDEGTGGEPRGDDGAPKSGS